MRPRRFSRRNSKSCTQAMRWEGIASKGSGNHAPMQHHESTRLVGSKHNDRELLNLLQPEQMKLASPQDLVLLVPQLQSAFL